jgi:4-amino-4-deoxy-L-arabinose transferase-like glycosyltransferase
MRSPSAPAERGARLADAALLAIVLLALGLRLWDLDRRAMSHPENYTPGIQVPDWARFPPPREDLVSTMKSVLRDGHPPLYFHAMLPWAKLTGTGLFAIRLPSAVLGAASVLLLYRIGLREAGRAAAATAALLLALHGHHLYWSQTARMYAPATFLGLLSTLLLCRALENGRARTRIAYGISAVAALWTHLYCWPVVFAQILWSTARTTAAGRRPAALPAQAVAIIVSLPVIALTIFQYRSLPLDQPRLEVLEFGYLFWSFAFSFGPAPAPPITHSALLVTGIAALAFGLLARPRPAFPPFSADATAPSRGLRLWLLALGAVVSAALVAATFKGFRPGTPRFVACLWLSAAPLALAWLTPRFDAWLGRAAADLESWVHGATRPFLRLAPVLALAPLACSVLAAAASPTFIARGTLMSLPYILLLAACGVTPSRAGPSRWLALPAWAAVVALHALSVPYSLHAEHNPRDYRALATVLAPRLLPDDLILITDQYTDQPLLYYFPNDHARFVPNDYATRLRAAPRARAWVILYEDQELTPALRDAVRDLHQAEAALAFGARALLFVR